MTTETGDRTAITVRYSGGERYDITTRGHTVVVDQPVEDGGEDLAPPSVELFVASLAGCVAFYAGRYLTRHGLSREGLGVTVTYRMARGRSARVAEIDLTVHVPESLPLQRREALLAVVQQCTVHNSLTTQPAIRIDLAP